MDITIRDHKQVVIFDINGEIVRSPDLKDTTLHQQVKAQLEQGKRDVLLDFTNVEFIDSFGVGEILASHISIHNLGGKLKLCRISKKLFLIFQVTMLNRVLEIYDDSESALKSFDKP